MSYELFSKRNSPPAFDVYCFDNLPKKLRVQIYYCWEQILKTNNFMMSSDNFQFQMFKLIEETMCREHGLLKLSNGYDSLEKCNNFLLNEKNIFLVIDIIELSVKYFKLMEEENVYLLRRAGINDNYKDLVHLINKRFKENGVGYEILEDQFFKKDEDFIYENSTKPALISLNEVGFTGAQEEFIEAYEHYKIGNNKDAISSAAKSFESTLKAVCTRKNWTINGKSTASNLINCIFENGLIPKYMQTHIPALKTTLEGLPTLRNNNGGHGQGEFTNEVPDYYASYALSLCATNIVFIIQAYKAEYY